MIKRTILIRMYKREAQYNFRDHKFCLRNCKRAVRTFVLHFPIPEYKLLVRKARKCNEYFPTKAETKKV